MKKLILLALMAIIMAGCTERNDDGSIHAPQSYSEGVLSFYTITIDSCEYIRGAHKLAHKGNCKFCEERRKRERKELKELIMELKELIRELKGK